MKKIILGLLLVFNVSLADNLLSENVVFKEGIKAIAMLRFDIYPNESENLRKNALRPFEVRNGTDDFIDLCECLYLYEAGRIGHLLECDIGRILLNWKVYLDTFKEEYQLKVIRMFATAGYVFNLVNRKNEVNPPNENKKRI